ncbi:site-specific integrase [Xanthomonas sp. WHRI 8391]|uniref:site-specific integrase n=1 Tax=Xanthomonas TaxID=338 RepID=UPI001A271CC9|nr:site-specific integrase [Xanthomonas hortorum]MBG3850080.1 site-specific integrase [Xanthomonas hortorum pv. carotae]UTS72702.1 site-specific integrase [Xanthomonas hortorum]
MPKITREPLTRRSVDSAKATGKAYRMRDATVPGLVLRVSATGARCWAIVWGRGQERIFGDYPALPLESARERARKLAGEIAAHGAPLAVIEAARPKPATLGSFVRDHYGPWAKANQKAGQATVDAIAAHFTEIVDKPLSAICAFDLERFKSQRLKAGIKPSTVNRDLSRIRGALSRAVDWGMIDQHPMRTVKQAKGADDSRVRYLTHEEERQLRAGLQQRSQGRAPHLLPMVLVALNTGMRRGELLGLDWADVNLPGKLVTVTVANAKSRKARHIPLNSEAHDTLARWREQGAGIGLVFPSPRTGRRMDNISSSWEELCDTIALPGFRFHDLRHTFASRLVMAGVDLNTVRELLGHSDIRMTLRYAHLAPDKLAEAVARL